MRKRTDDRTNFLVDSFEFVAPASEPRLPFENGEHQSELLDIHIKIIEKGRNKNAKLKTLGNPAEDLSCWTAKESSPGNAFVRSIDVGIRDTRDQTLKARALCVRDEPENSARKHNVGDILKDGWVYLGTSPGTGKPYSLQPAESQAKQTMRWDEAKEFATSLRDYKPAHPVRTYCRSLASRLSL